MDERGTLAGRTALVTGGDSGIGRGVVLSLVRAGARVGVNYAHDRDGAENVVREAARLGGEAIALCADVSREDEVEAMFAECSRRLGPLDVLVSNAGLQKDAAFTAMGLDEWRAVLDVNLTGGFLCARAAARAFLARPDAASVRSARRGVLGVILFMSSVHQDIPWAGHVNYAASKGGLAMLMKSVAQELAPQGIRAAAVAPGAIATPINESAWKDEKQADRLRELIPLGRIGEAGDADAPGDVGPAVAWLASDEAAYVTGTTLYVDGGMLLYPGFRIGG